MPGGPSGTCRGDDQPPRLHDLRRVGQPAARDARARRPEAAVGPDVPDDDPVVLGDSVNSWLPAVSISPRSDLTGVAVEGSPGDQRPVAGSTSQAPPRPRSPTVAAQRPVGRQRDSSTGSPVGASAAAPRPRPVVEGHRAVVPQQRRRRTGSGRAVDGAASRAEGHHGAWLPVARSTSVEARARPTRRGARSTRSSETSASRSPGAAREWPAIPVSRRVPSAGRPGPAARWIGAPSTAGTKDVQLRPSAVNATPNGTPPSARGSTSARRPSASTSRSHGPSVPTPARARTGPRRRGVDRPPVPRSSAAAPGSLGAGVPEATPSCRTLRDPAMKRVSPPSASSSVPTDLRERAPRTARRLLGQGGEQPVLGLRGVGEPEGLGGQQVGQVQGLDGRGQGRQPVRVGDQGCPARHRRARETARDGQAATRATTSTAASPPRAAAYGGGPPPRGGRGRGRRSARPRPAPSRRPGTAAPRRQVGVRAGRPLQRRVQTGAPVQLVVGPPAVSHSRAAGARCRRTARPAASSSSQRASRGHAVSSASWATSSRSPSTDSRRRPTKTSTICRRASSTSRARPAAAAGGRAPRRRRRPPAARAGGGPGRGPRRPAPRRRPRPTGSAHPRHRPPPGTRPGSGGRRAAAPRCRRGPWRAAAVRPPGRARRRRRRRAVPARRDSPTAGPVPARSPGARDRPAEGRARTTASSRSVKAACSASRPTWSPRTTTTQRTTIPSSSSPRTASRNAVRSAGSTSARPQLLELVADQQDREWPAATPRSGPPARRRVSCRG